MKQKLVLSTLCMLFVLACNAQKLNKLSKKEESWLGVIV
jgi:hypothetical protein